MLAPFLPVPPAVFPKKVCHQFAEQLSIVREQLFIRTLRERAGEMVREAGYLSIVTKQGRPLFGAVPVDERLLKDDVAVALPVRLYAEKVVSVGKAAKLARLFNEDFIVRPGAIGGSGPSTIGPTRLTRSWPHSEETIRDAAAASYSQFSVLTPGIRINSRRLLVATVSPSLRAWPPICMSCGPHGVPARSSSARSWP